MSDTATAGADGKIPWRVIAELPSDSSCATYSLEPTDADMLAALQKAEPDAKVVCEIDQAGKSELTNGTCIHENVPRWCYVTGANGCSQSILFSEPLAAGSGWKFFAVVP